MQGNTPVLPLATEVLLTEDVDPPAQPGLLRPASRPRHGLLPALSQEGVEGGEGEDNLGQEGHLAGLRPLAVQRDVAGLVQTDRAGVATREEPSYLSEVTAIIELFNSTK